MKRLRKWFIGDLLAKTDDVFERSRIELTYDYSVFFFVLGGIFYINLIANQLWYHFYIITFACISLVTIPFILKYKENLRLAANWYVIQQIITSVISSYLQEFRADIAGGFWTLAFILYAMFMFGVKGGLLRSIPFVAVFGFTLYANSFSQKLDLGIPDSQQLPEQSFFTIVPFLLCIYAISTFIKTRGKAEKYIDEQKMLLETKNKEVTDSISYAQRIQAAILPSQQLIEEYLPTSLIVYLPKDIVSGDFYWVEKKDERVFFAVADCTGHGVPGAMMSVICQNALNRVLNEFGITEPAKMLDKLNLLVQESFSKSGANIRDGMDIALCSLNYPAKTLEFAGANNSIYYTQEGILREIKGNKQPIGRFESNVPFTNHHLQLSQNDMLFLFSDGIADQFGGPQGKKFKYKRVRELLQSKAKESIEMQKNNIVSSFSEWKGKLEQVDDVCVMGVKI